MAGGFVNKYYEPDNVATLGTMNIKVDTDTVALTAGGTENDGTGTAPTKLLPTVYAKPRARRYGFYARTIAVEFAAANVPTGYKAGQRLSVPILTKALFDAINPGDDVTYLGKTATVLSKSGEYAV